MNSKAPQVELMGILSRSKALRSADRVVELARELNQITRDWGHDTIIILLLDL